MPYSEVMFDRRLENDNFSSFTIFQPEDCCNWRHRENGQNILDLIKVNKQEEKKFWHEFLYCHFPKNNVKLPNMRLYTECKPPTGNSHFSPFPCTPKMIINSPLLISQREMLLSIFIQLMLISVGILLKYCLLGTSHCLTFLTL